MIKIEKHQRYSIIVLCYRLGIFHKTGYQLRLFYFNGNVRRLSFCVVRHQRSSLLTSGRPAAPTSTLPCTWKYYPCI